MEFFKAWIDINKSIKYLAYDVTSFSTHAKSIIDSEFGYNRDGDSLPQINLGCYLAYETKMPIFYTTYQGSIVDKSNLPYIIQHNEDLNINDVIFVMDRGFYSTSNIMWMHTDDLRYLIAVESYHKTTKNVIDKVINTIRTYQYECAEGVYGRTLSSRSYGVRAKMHVYFSKDLWDRKSSDLYRTINNIKDKLDQLDKLTPKQAKSFRKYYDITLEKNGDFTYEINYQKVNDIEKYLGFFCIYSNTCLDISTILNIYRSRDTIEKSFDDIKNHIDMKRMRTHNTDTTDGKIFCAFIALIALSKISEKVKDLNKKGGRRRLSKERLLAEMEKIKVVTLSGGRNLMNALTKTQRDMLDAFGIKETDLRSYASRL
jgi:transposase